MADGKILHPYKPRDLEIPHYVPNDKPLTEILGVFFGGVAVIMVSFWLYMNKQAHIRGSLILKSKLCWFLACGLIHFVLEGYFAVFHQTLAGEQTFLAQLWKEYSKGDSRYIISDTFTVCMETITAFIDGPLAFVAVYAFITQKPYRFVVQLLLSLCQLYGDVLYFSTEVKDGFIHGEMWHPLYFWFYFFFMNILWIIIPSACIIESCGVLTRAQATTDTNNKASNNTKKRK